MCNQGPSLTVTIDTLPAELNRVTPRQAQWRFSVSVRNCVQTCATRRSDPYLVTRRQKTQQANVLSIQTYELRLPPLRRRVHCLTTI